MSEAVDVEVGLALLELSETVDDPDDVIGDAIDRLATMQEEIARLRAPSESSEREAMVIYDCPDCGPGGDVDEEGKCAKCGLDDVVSDTIADPVAEAISALRRHSLAGVATYGEMNRVRAIKLLELAAGSPSSETERVELGRELMVEQLAVKGFCEFLLSFSDPESVKDAIHATLRGSPPTEEDRNG